jgi:hypothetical protein
VQQRVQHLPAAISGAAFLRTRLAGGALPVFHIPGHGCSCCGVLKRSLRTL